MKEQFLFKLTSLIFWLYIRFTAFTSSIIWKNREIPERFRKNNKPYILAFWHNRQFFLCYSEMKTNLSVIMSASKDGEYIARIAKMFKVTPIRGSSSKGGVAALKKMLVTLRKNNNVGITPDGPRGPKYSIQPGIIHLAKKTGVPVIPVSCNARRQKIFNSWDNYQVPYPFNKIIVAYSEPLYLSPDIDNEEASILIKDALHKVTNETDIFFKNNR